MSKWHKVEGDAGDKYLLRGLPDGYVVEVAEVCEGMWMWELNCDKSHLYSGNFYVSSPDFASDRDFSTADKAQKNVEKELPKKLKRIENAISKIKKVLK